MIQCSLAGGRTVAISECARAAIVAYLVAFAFVIPDFREQSAECLQPVRFSLDTVCLCVARTVGDREHRTISGSIKNNLTKGLHECVPVSFEARHGQRTLSSTSPHSISCSAQSSSSSPSPTTPSWLHFCAVWPRLRPGNVCTIYYIAIHLRSLVGPAFFAIAAAARRTGVT